METRNVDENKVRKEVRKMFGGSLKLRQVSAAGDKSCEWELNAAGNVNFDVGRFGIEFVASPRHADGMLLRPHQPKHGEPLEICYKSYTRSKNNYCGWHRCNQWRNFAAARHSIVRSSINIG
jgi:NADH:ubiquinone oxidoreductase subunit B-like Fe-S oxidoreductase